MTLKKGVKLLHYKGGRYTVIDQGTHSETLEDMIIYQNDKDKKIWIRPLNMFYEDVNYKGKTVPRFEVIHGNPHGGIRHRIIDLEIGTKFYVCNGGWNGEIVFFDGKKKVLINGMDINQAMEITEDYTLDIEIK